jgi:hypothetical protein
MTSPQLRDGTDLYIEQVRFGKDEIQRRKDSPVYINGDEIARAYAEADHIVYIVDPRLGFNNRTHRFWSMLKPNPAPCPQFARNCQSPAGGANVTQGQWRRQSPTQARWSVRNLS